MKFGNDARVTSKYVTFYQVVIARTFHFQSIGKKAITARLYLKAVLRPIWKVLIIAKLVFVLII